MQTRKLNENLMRADLDLENTPYTLYTKSYPTDASFVIVGSFGFCIEYLIEETGWQIIEKLLSKKEDVTKFYIVDTISSLLILSKAFPDQFDCKVNYPTKI